MNSQPHNRAKIAALAEMRHVLRDSCSDFKEVTFFSKLTFALSYDATPLLVALTST